MKTRIKDTNTTTGSLFNHTGILHHAGDYAGKYQEQAFELFDCVSHVIGSEWCDIMHDSKGQLYAVWAEDSLTCQNAKCVYHKLNKRECIEAWEEAQTHIE